MNLIACTLVTGIVATLLMDLWGLARRPLLGQKVPDYAPVGRWFGHMASGRVRHASIAAAAPVRGERALGWLVHYLTGIAFAALLLTLAGPGWLLQPALLPALAVGIGTVAAPFLLMQPAMGAGFAAARTANPNAARRQSLVTHAVFGAGLYAGGWAAHALCLP
jgi:hypothetical protein